jgi:HrpJ-like domain
MNQSSDQHAGLGWLHVVPMVAIAVLAIALWRPGADPPPTPEQEEKIADLVELLGSSSSSASDIDDRLRSFGPFPPDAKASLALAEALVTCGAGRLDAAQRTQLARQLYGITVIGDSRTEVVPAAMMGLQRFAAAASCSPSEIDELMRAARAVASTDPGPRKDWW